MKKNNFWKRFWTLNVHNHEGFTLVELIIVIAILAILSSVAVVGYSAYIKKANKQADETMISEIANVLTLKYYSDGIDGSAFVVFKDGDVFVSTTNDFAKDALVDAFGENWKGTLQLKANEWNAAAQLNAVLTEAAGIINDSSFMQNTTPSELVNAFSGVTDALTDMAITTSRDPLEAASFALTAEQKTAIENELEDMGLSYTPGGDNTAYSTAVSNLMVKYVADELGSFDPTVQEDPDSGLAGAAISYAIVYAWASGGSEEQQAVLESLNAAMNNDELSAQELLDTINSATEKVLNDEAYMDEKYEGDYLAFLSVMGAVSDITDDFDMSTEGLFSSDSIAPLVDNYTNAIKTIVALSAEDVAKLADADVAILISNSGIVTIYK